MKKYERTYSEEQINELYRYLMAKPMIEAEKLVTILRNPVMIKEVNQEISSEEKKD